MTSGVPQGSVLFVIYRHDLEENVTGLMSKFADDTKVGGFADSDEDHQRIHQDIRRLETWAERWQMEFNPDKCEEMHFGRSNTEHKNIRNRSRSRPSSPSSLPPAFNKIMADLKWISTTYPPDPHNPEFPDRSGIHPSVL